MANSVQRSARRFFLFSAGVRFFSPVFKLLGTYANREHFYQAMFYRAADANGLTLPPLYPVQSAANYSLLYTILRAATELPVKSILELGAGQSTFLFDAIAKRTPDLSVTTIETDQKWAERIGARVSHSVHQVTLERRTIRERSALAYRDLSILGDRRFDMVVIDGPVGTRRYSRWGSLEVLDRHLADQFIVIFDDADRAGECDTIKAFIGNSSTLAGCRAIRSVKAQFMAFTSEFDSALFF